MSSGCRRAWRISIQQLQRPRGVRSSPRCPAGRWHLARAERGLRNHGRATRMMENKRPLGTDEFVSLRPAKRCRRDRAGKSCRRAARDRQGPTGRADDQVRGSALCAFALLTACGQSRRDP